MSRKLALNLGIKISLFLVGLFVAKKIVDSFETVEESPTKKKKSNRVYAVNPKKIDMTVEAYSPNRTSW